jgi:hypothetical protein
MMRAEVRSGMSIDQLGVLEIHLDSGLPWRYLVLEFLDSSSQRIVGLQHTV